MNDLLSRSRIEKLAQAAIALQRDITSYQALPTSRSPAWLDLSEKDRRQYSVVKLVNLMAGGAMGNQRRLDGLEGECAKALADRLGSHPKSETAVYIPADILQQRDLEVATPGAAGYLIGTTTASFIDCLRAHSVLFRLGAQRLSDLREQIALPRAATPNTVSWQSTESTSITEGSPGFEQVSGSPHIAGTFIELSPKFLKQISPAADAFLLELLAKDLAVGVDQAGLNGSGSSGQPRGILQTSGISTCASSGASMNYSAVVQAQVDVVTANAAILPEALAYVTTPAVAQLAKGRQRFTSATDPLWAGAVHEGTVEGARAVSTTLMPTGKLLYGDWSQIVVAEWGVLAIESDPFSKFQTGIVGVRGLYAVDILVLHPQSFTQFSNPS